MLHNLGNIKGCTWNYAFFAISSFGEKNKFKTLLSAIFIKDDVLISVRSDK